MREGRHDRPIKVETFLSTCIISNAEIGKERKMHDVTDANAL